MKFNAYVEREFEIPDTLYEELKSEAAESFAVKPDDVTAEDIFNLAVRDGLVNVTNEENWKDVDYA